MSKTDTVQAADTGHVPGDFRGTRTLNAAPTAPMHDPTAGRHSIGSSPSGNIGKYRSGQEEPDGNHPITGVARTSPVRSMEPVPSIPANQAETSKNLEQVLSTPPTPFKYEGGAATLLPGSVRFAEVGIGYEYKSEPDAPLSKRGYGAEVMSKGEMEAAASVDGMPQKGYNPINGGRASWMRKD